MKVKHGPSISSNKKLNRKKLLKQIFGTDSEETSESEQEKHTAQLIKQTQEQLLNESETDNDVLDISIGNELASFGTPTKESQIESLLPKTPTFEFITPSKLQRITQVRPFISPLAKTPQPKSSLFATSPYSIRIQSPVQLSAQNHSEVHAKILNNARYEEYLQHQSRITERDSTPLKWINFKPYSRVQTQQLQTNSLSYAQKQNAQKPNALTPTKQKSHTQQAKEAEHQPKNTPLHAVTHTHFRESQKQHANIRARAPANTASQATARTQASELVREHTQTHKQLHTARNRFAPYINTKPTPIPTPHEIHTKSQAKSHTIKERIGNKKDNEQESQPSLFLHGRRIYNSTSTNSIVERHNFEREIRIEVKTDQHPPTNEIENKIVNALSQKETPTTAPKTRIISLQNKNVPKGVQLAIAVDSKKFFSKNALKKITRNLAKEIQ